MNANSSYTKEMRLSEKRASSYLTANRTEVNSMERSTPPTGAEKVEATPTAAPAANISLHRLSLL